MKPNSFPPHWLKTGRSVKESNSKLLALLRLSKEGVGAERTTASSLLKKHLDRLGMSLADLEGDENEISTHIFDWNKKTPFDRELLAQIIGQVMRGKVSVYSYKNVNNGHKGSKYGVDCTKKQAAEISIRQELYRKALHDELELTFEAFVQLNRITKPPEDDDADDELDLERLEKLMNRMLGIEPTAINAQIEVIPT